MYNVFSDFKILKNISPYHPKTDPTGNGLKSAKMIKIDILTTLKKIRLSDVVLPILFHPLQKIVSESLSNFSCHYRPNTRVNSGTYHEQYEQN